MSRVAGDRAAVPDEMLRGLPARAWVFDPERRAMLRLEGSVLLER